MVVTSASLQSSTPSVIFPSLTTGVMWYFRVLATNDIGDSLYSSVVSATPASTPLGSSYLSIVVSSGQSITATYAQDADPQGSAITSYVLTAQSTASTINITLPITNRVQRIVSSAYTLPFALTSTFTLSLGSFYGKYFEYDGSNSTFSVLVTATSSNMVRSSVNSDVWQVLRNTVTPGEFISIGDQEFRVCMNTDPVFVAQYGALSASVIPLCSVYNPYVMQMFDNGYSGNTLIDLPVYVLDTIVGGAVNPRLGSSILTIQNADRSINTNVNYLNIGDYIMIGHPVDGEVFRIYTKNSNSSILSLAPNQIGPVAASASITIKSLQHSTFEVQSISFTNTSIIPDIKSVGFRIVFKGATTFSTTIGGESGCLNLFATADQVQQELIKLSTIDNILVSKIETNTRISYRLTFVGDNVRGAQPFVTVVDLGVNGCNSNAGSVVTYAG